MMMTSVKEKSDAVRRGRWEGRKRKDVSLKDGRTETGASGGARAG